VGDWGYSGLAVKRTEDDYGLLPEAAGEPGGHIELEQTRIEARGDLRLDLGPFTRLDYGAQHSDYEHIEFEGSGEPGTTFTSEGWEGRVEAHHGGEMLEGAIGVQYSDVDFAAAGGEAFITPTNTQDTGVFVVERWDTGVWGLEGGARFENHKLDNETAGSRDFDNVSGSAGVFFRPAQDWFVGGTLAHTERGPTQIELFADGPHLATESFELGDPTLDQEKANSIEVSTRYTADARGFEVNVFRMEFTDYIALVDRGDFFWFNEDLEEEGFAPTEDDPSIPDGSEVLPVFVFTQQDASFTGGEISGWTQLFDAGGFTFSGDAALDLVQAEFDAGGHPPRIPPRTLTVGLQGENESWTGRIEAVDTAEQDDLGQNETPTDGFTFLNASLAFRPFGNARDLTLRLDGRNLTDELGRVHASFLKDELPLPGRSLRVALVGRF
jgi:iron complex outermembrane receptor protein